ncbi:N-carbamoyl-L-amino-acid hydrolase [Spinactinospora alkalitolerans]|uniref:N-carbamoyl-L-amino-acid hydrolase n=1 Tax=Spinactinospora alkalitolerans TaxID=687207 RepID=A0A852TYE6_9ACTN|nr:Zn-dependent hydrolase [Spinactinospora alkalitolerans]NYE48012.1 N-carbamoyl-L-amino-acid hydrolase [Spinactinospora alkalitolerans]
MPTTLSTAEDGFHRFGGSVRVDGARLIRRLGELGRIGSAAGKGVSRLAFSPEDQQARQLVVEYMREAGLAPYVDPAGNIVARDREADSGEPVLMLGSHIDTVPGGGAYDGSVGVLAAIEVAQTVKENSLPLRSPLVVTVFADEEGTRGTPPMWGSHAMAGSLTEEHLATVTTAGEPMDTLVASVGGDLSRIAAAAWPAGAIDTYLELHIEQGPVLEHHEVDIGIVEAISGRVSITVDIDGRAAHAGTTPMELRSDALVAAARIILAVQDIADRERLVRVATVGRCEVTPGTWNVVPGRVRIPIDLRDIDLGALDRAITAVRRLTAQIADQTSTTITATTIDRVLPAPCDPTLRRLLAEASDELKLTRIEMASGAGHDAQVITSIAPAAMVFIPSVNGISHAPDEYSEACHIVNGADILLRAATSHVPGSCRTPASAPPQNATTREEHRCGSSGSAE